MGKGLFQGKSEAGCLCSKFIERVVTYGFLNTQVFFSGESIVYGLARYEFFCSNRQVSKELRPPFFSVS